MTKALRSLQKVMFIKKWQLILSLSYRIQLYPIVSCRVVSYPDLSYAILSCPIVLCHIISYPILSCSILYPIINNIIIIIKIYIAQIS